MFSALFWRGVKFTCYESHSSKEYHFMNFEKSLCPLTHTPSKIQSSTLTRTVFLCPFLTISPKATSILIFYHSLVSLVPDFHINGILNMYSFVFSFFCPTSVCKIHSCVGYSLYIPIYLWVVFYGINMLYFPYPFSCCGHLGYFQCLPIIKKADMNISVRVLLGIHAVISLG